MAVKGDPNGRPDHTSGVERPSDETAREGNVTRQSIQGETVSADSNKSRTIYTNNSGSTQFLTNVGAVCYIGWTPDTRIRVFINDGNGNRQSDLHGHVDSFPANPDPPMKIEDGWKLGTAMRNPALVQAEFDLTYLIRDDVG